ncbi:MAG: triose-phosphate isomerase [Pseudomonadota bacterium]
MRRTPRPLVAGNWKMNGLKSSLREARAIAASLAKSPASCDVMICPPATLLRPMKDAVKGSKLKLGGQDCHASSQGAHTGDVSAEMLKDAGATAVIVGHSERRADHGESNMQVRSKAAAAHRAGLIAIICVGETLAERKAGAARRVVGHQLKGSLPVTANEKNTVIAYEPVWAIGSGLTPTLEDVAEVHSHIRKRLGALMTDGAPDRVRLLYGGSVKPANAAELLATQNVDGALVGGASLSAKDFLGIIGAGA